MEITKKDYEGWRVARHARINSERVDVFHAHDWRDDVFHVTHSEYLWVSETGREYSADLAKDDEGYYLTVFEIKNRRYWARVMMNAGEVDEVTTNSFQDAMKFVDEHDRRQAALIESVTTDDVVGDILYSEDVELFQNARL